MSGAATSARSWSCEATRILKARDEFGDAEIADGLAVARNDRVPGPSARAIGLEADGTGGAADGQEHRQPVVVPALVEAIVRHALIDEQSVIHLHQLTLMLASVLRFALAADQPADVNGGVRSGGELPVEDNDRGLTVEYGEEEVVSVEVVVHQGERRSFEQVLENLMQVARNQVPGPRRSPA